MNDDAFYNLNRYSMLQLSNRDFLYENLNEGLIKSYSVGDVKRWLDNEMNFQCIENVIVLRHNTYMSKKKALSDDEFIEIVLKNDIRSLFSYEKNVDSCYCLLGWFTGIINVKVNHKNGGHRPFVFYRGEPYRHAPYDHDFRNRFFSEQTDDKLKVFLKKHMSDIYSMSLIIEEKFPIRQYIYYDEDTFYHKTEKDRLEGILRDGLVPKSRSNHPSRIYLTNNIDVLDDIELDLKKNNILKIRLNHNQKIYKDPRSMGFFTYDNIYPDEIEVLG